MKLRIERKYWLLGAVAALVVAGAYGLSVADGVTAKASQDPAPAPAPTDPLDPYFAAADENESKLVELIERGSAAIESAASSEEAHKISTRLEPYSRKVFFSSLRPKGMERLDIAIHTVESKQLPKAIGKRYRFDPHLLSLLNDDYDAKKLRVGQKLKVLDLIDGSLRVLVDKTHYRVAIWKKAPGRDGKLLLGYWPVGLGKVTTETPTGTTFIEKRVRDPSWTDPDTKKTFLAGDPQNVLGGFWMALDSNGIHRDGIGFHGYTGAPAANWIEQPASHGCVRMLQADIGILYDIALEGTPVDLRAQ